MSESSHSTSTARIALVGLTALAQVVAGILTSYVTYVLVPESRETFQWGAAATAIALEPLVVPIGLAVGAYLIVRRIGSPSFDYTHLALLFGVAFVGYYVGFWAVGIPRPTPGGAIPVHDNLMFWQLFEPSPFLLWAWSAFLTPGVEGGIATLAGIGAAVNRTG